MGTKSLLPNVFGEREFQCKFPCDPSDLTYFRKRVGNEGFEKILAVSIHLHGEKIGEKDISVDTTVQEKKLHFQRMINCT